MQVAVAVVHKAKGLAITQQGSELSQLGCGQRRHLPVGLRCQGVTDGHRRLVQILPAVGANGGNAAVPGGIAADWRCR